MSRVLDWIPVTKGQVQGVLSLLSPDWIFESMEGCEKGNRTTNYKIRLTNGKMVLLRVYPSGVNASKKEMAVYESMETRIPVPDIYGSGVLETDHAYLLMRVLPGENLESLLDRGMALSQELCWHAGALLAEVHKREYPKEGLLDDALELQAGLPPILEWMPYFLGGKPGRKLGEELCLEIRQTMEACREDWERIVKDFVFTHGDFRPANVLVDMNQITGVLDWEFALSAPRYFDIGQWIRIHELFSKEALEAFAKGYEEVSGIDLPPDWERLARLMDIATMMSFLDRCEEMTDLDQAMMKRIQWNTAFVKR